MILLLIMKVGATAKDIAVTTEVTTEVVEVASSAEVVAAIAEVVGAAIAEVVVVAIAVVAIAVVATKYQRSIGVKLDEFCLL